MGKYRSIPQDVEAVQYGGINKKTDEPIFRDMGNTIPTWLWRGMMRQEVLLKDGKVFVNGNELATSDWVIFDGLFIGHMDDKKFGGTFAKARKFQSDMKSAARPMNAKAKKIKDVPAVPPTALPEPEPDLTDMEKLMLGQPEAGEVVPDDMLKAFSEALGVKVFPDTGSAETTEGEEELNTDRAQLRALAEQADQIVKSMIRSAT